VDPPWKIPIPLVSIINATALPLMYLAWNNEYQFFDHFIGRDKNAEPFGFERAAVVCAFISPWIVAVLPLKPKIRPLQHPV
jgi:hypothetical protein